MPGILHLQHIAEEAVTVDVRVKVVRHQVEQLTDALRLVLVPPLERARPLTRLLLGLDLVEGGEQLYVAKPLARPHDPLQPAAATRISAVERQELHAAATLTLRVVVIALLEGHLRCGVEGRQLVHLARANEEEVARRRRRRRRLLLHARDDGAELHHQGAQLLHEHLDEVVAGHGQEAVELVDKLLVHELDQLRLDNVGQRAPVLLERVDAAPVVVVAVVLTHGLGESPGHALEGKVALDLFHALLLDRAELVEVGDDRGNVADHVAEDRRTGHLHDDGDDRLDVPERDKAQARACVRGVSATWRRHTGARAGSAQHQRRARLQSRTGAVLGAAGAAHAASSQATPRAPPPGGGRGGGGHSFPAALRESHGGERPVEHPDVLLARQDLPPPDAARLALAVPFPRPLGVCVADGGRPVVGQQIYPFLGGCVLAAVKLRQAEHAKGAIADHLIGQEDEACDQVAEEDHDEDELKEFEHAHVDVELLLHHLEDLGGLQQPDELHETEHTQEAQQLGHHHRRVAISGGGAPLHLWLRRTEPEAGDGEPDELNHRFCRQRGGPVDEEPPLQVSAGDFRAVRLQRPLVVYVRRVEVEYDVYKEEHVEERL
eukprot:scaffold65096_cov63-Phaeocystis_antarctica.AAC.4